MDTNINFGTSASPKVSVIIPTHNRADLVGFAIQSVLDQTFEDFELIVIDDGSTDNTEAAIKKFDLNNDGASKSFRYVKHDKNLGISRTRNEGLDLARGKYIAMLDSDDFWIDTAKLAKQVEFLETHPDHVIVGTFLKKIDEKNNAKNDDPELVKKFETKDEEIRRKLLGTNQFMQSSLLFSKDAAQKAGGYDNSLATMEDHDLWLKLLEIGKGANLDMVGLGYRIHPGSISIQKRRRIALDEFAVIKRHSKNYPGRLHAYTKGLVRVILASLNLY